MKFFTLMFLLLFSLSVKAETFTLVVPYPPGGTVDLVARIVGESLVKQGHRIIIENRGGAEGRVPYTHFSRLRNQPNTLIMGASGPMYFSQLLTTDVAEYDVRNFTPIIHMGKAYHFILAHPSTGVKNPRDLIDLLKSNKDVTFASGNATSRFMLEYFFNVTKTKALTIPYNGGGPAYMAMISGYVPFGAETTPSSVPHIESKKLNAVAITSLKRIPQAQGVKTVSESIKRDFEVFSTYAILGTQDLDVKLQKQFNEIFNKALQDVVLRDKFYKYHIDITGGDSNYLKNDIESQKTRWSSISIHK